jgi:hypothetical protein
MQKTPFPSVPGQFGVRGVDRGYFVYGTNEASASTTAVACSRTSNCRAVGNFEGQYGSNNGVENGYFFSG